MGKEKIDINNKFWYGTNLGYDDKLTRERLIELNELGCDPNYVSASFRIDGVFSGLYIEKVWSYDAERWRSYINWIKKLKREKQKKNKEEI
jgi:hypothetical protein